MNTTFNIVPIDPHKSNTFDFYLEVFMFTGLYQLFIEEPDIF